MKLSNLIKRSLPLCLLLAAGVFVLTAALKKPDGSGYKVGDKAADFKLKNAVDGNMVSLANNKEAKGAIVIFTCNHCPFSVAYEDRIIALHNKYAPQGYPVIAINPNDVTKQPDDSYEKMQERAKEKDFPFAYLIDPTQETARTYGASRTPHVFVLSSNKGKYKVEYIGAIDNNKDEPEKVTERYVEDAVDALLSGKKISKPFTKAIGCGIKWRE